MSEGSKPRGLAAVSPERRREIASMGGKSVPKVKRAFSDKKLARSAGKRGGLRSKQKEDSRGNTKLV